MNLCHLPEYWYLSMETIDYLYQREQIDNLKHNISISTRTSIFIQIFYIIYLPRVPSSCGLIVLKWNPSISKMRWRGVPTDIFKTSTANTYLII